MKNDYIFQFAGEPEENYTPDPELYNALITEALSCSPGMTWRDYFRRYRPDIAFNECCVQCAGYTTCPWSRGVPIPGWVADTRRFIYRSPGKKPYRTVRHKIFWCPRFTQDTGEHPPYTDDGVIRLIGALFREEPDPAPAADSPKERRAIDYGRNGDRQRLPSRLEKR